MPAVDAGADTLSSPGLRNQLHGRRLLIVDDHSDELELFSVVLQAEGAEVSTANSASAALESLMNNPPDALVSDIAMPEQDGYELLRLVRELPSERGGAIPAIAVTAYARIEDRERALASGFQAFVTKPVEPKKLVEAVASVVERLRSGD
jgi:CheY-like chemotaxis protein